MSLIIANAIDLLAAIVQVSSGAIKEKTKILIVQTVQLLMQGISMLLLGGVTGAINNVLSCLRNYLCYKDKLNLVWKIIIVVISAALTLIFNEQGLLGILPAVVCTIYIFLMDIKDLIGFKWLTTLSFLPWMFYHFMLGSYVGAAFDAATIITNAITLFTMIRNKKLNKA